MAIVRPPIFLCERASKQRSVLLERRPLWPKGERVKRIRKAEVQKVAKRDVGVQLPSEEIPPIAQIAAEVFQMDILIARGVKPNSSIPNSNQQNTPFPKNKIPR